ncbi:MAG: hypothetical protein JNM36_04855 [Chitinophagales bacterium]|nr:hypothetical protein [Chitinophagales bacterium]
MIEIALMVGIYLGVTLRVGLYRASLCYGAALLSALANATLTIPNAASRLERASYCATP